jgi:LacI family transcriptional regulator
LSADPQIDGVYVCTANSMPVIEALRETGRLGRTTVVTTDLFPGLVPYLRNGEVLATLYQRPITQGRMAFQSLYRFLVEGVCPPLRRRLAPHIILRSNLDLFLELKPEETDGTEYRAMPLPQVAKRPAR